MPRWDFSLALLRALIIGGHVKREGREMKCICECGKVTKNSLFHFMQDNVNEAEVINDDENFCRRNF